ncbi:MAG: DNA double-strand break repair nuclease NurA [Saccharolobus sp.]
MIGKIYDMIIEKNEELKTQIYDIEKYLKEKIGDNLSNNWIEYSPKGSYKKFVAIDGGLFARSMRIGIVYAIDAEAVLGDREKVEVIADDGRFGIFKPGNNAKERINLLMQGLELKLALESGNLGDYILLDGSLDTKLGERVHIVDLSREEFSLVKNFDIDGIIAIKNEEKMSKLLRLLNQSLLSQVLGQYGNKVLFISKNSRTRDIFDTDYSDITVLELFTQSSGYTKPKIKNISYNLESLRELVYSSFYVRLETGHKVLKIDVIGSIDDNTIKEIMDSLAEVSVKGYPFPLLKAHMDVRISNADRKRIIQMVGGKLHKDIEWWPSQFF